MDAILVRRCPQCGKSHLYSLSVERSYWMGVDEIPATPQRFTRLFTCPETEEDFQVTLTLMQPHGEDYDNITVNGYIDGAEDLGEIPSQRRYYEEQGLVDKLLTDGIDDGDLDVPPGGLIINRIKILGIFRG